MQRANNSQTAFQKVTVIEMKMIAARITENEVHMEVEEGVFPANVGLATKGTTAAIADRYKRADIGIP